MVEKTSTPSWIWAVPVVIAMAEAVSGYPCSPWEFQCRSRDCVTASKHCDHHMDCSDGSDEVGCDMGLVYPRHTCPEGEFMCASGDRCISDKWVCDGQDDCGDMSDETGCPPEQPNYPIGVSAMIGIGLACATLMVITVAAIIFACYQKRKNTMQSRRRSRLARHEELPPNLAYNIPQEALLREPPPRYTSQEDLAIVNPGFRDVEAVSPPPYYSSNPNVCGGLSLYDSFEPPPTYCSHQDIARLADVTLTSSRDHDITDRSGGHISTISTGTMSDSISSPGLNQSRFSGDITAAQMSPHIPPVGGVGSKRHRTLVLSQSTSDSTCTLTNSKDRSGIENTSTEDDKPRSFSFQVSGGEPVDSKLESSTDSVSQHPQHELVNSKEKARSSPCLSSAPFTVGLHEPKVTPAKNDSTETRSSTEDGKKVKHSDKKRKPRRVSSKSSPSKHSRRSSHEEQVAPSPGHVRRQLDMAAWGAEILACSSNAQLASSARQLHNIPEQDSAPDQDSGIGSSTSRVHSPVVEDLSQSRFSPCPNQDHASLGSSSRGSVSHDRSRTASRQLGGSKHMSRSLPQLSRISETQMSTRHGSTMDVSHGFDC